MRAMNKGKRIIYNTSKFFVNKGQSMNVILVTATEELKHDNNGFEYGIMEINEEGHIGDYVEWFETEVERQQTLDDATNNMKVI